MRAQEWLTLLILTILSDSIAAAVGAWHLIRNSARATPLRAAGLMLLAIAIDGVCVMVAQTDRPHGVHYSAWYVWWFLAGRILRSAAIWYFVLALLSPRRK